MIKVVIIGSGNVAHHLIKICEETETIDLIQVVVRNKIAVQQLVPATKIITDYQLIAQASVYILAVSDKAIPEVSEKLPFQNRLVVHTSGASEMTIINSKNRKGVFYPLQTFSKNKNILFNEIPICLETQFPDDYTLLETLAQQISQKVLPISSSQRKSLHLAAVFVCNFVNHLYHIGHEICIENQVPFEILHPLIQETAAKIQNLLPSEAQTGPAIRNDTQTIQNHLDLLHNQTNKELYKLITKSIQNVKKL